MTAWTVQMWLAAVSTAILVTGALIWAGRNS